jgi:putative tryptophan/tyrosine transport system substrate-binding protein
MVLGHGTNSMRRREFIAFVGSTAAAWPLAGRAQQPAMPVIGLLSVRAAGDAPQLTAAFLMGLNEVGFNDGQNVAIEYRYADNQNDRLPALAADLVQHQVIVIAATTTPAALVAKAATTTIPIVFETAADPIKLGLVTSLNRPQGNITGITQSNVEVLPKRLEVLHELFPTAKTITLLVNPANPALAETNTSALLVSARTLGLELRILKASTEAELKAVFANLKGALDLLVIAGDPFFTGHSELLAALAVQHDVPTVYQGREFAVGGGLMSYGARIDEAYRLVGVYTGRILKGEKPAELPVQQATKVELIINLKSAKALGVSVPLSLLGRADEVIE